MLRKNYVCKNLYRISRSFFIVKERRRRFRMVVVFEDAEVTKLKTTQQLSSNHPMNTALPALLYDEKRTTPEPSAQRCGSSSSSRFIGWATIRERTSWNQANGSIFTNSRDATKQRSTAAVRPPRSLPKKVRLFQPAVVRKQSVRR